MNTFTVPVSMLASKGKGGAIAASELPQTANTSKARIDATIVFMRAPLCRGGPDLV